MDTLSKTPRKRVANFTADEKALLAQLIKRRPIIESKITDGKSIAKKAATWEIITQEFNCHANVHKRDTTTLKRAWDNMKAVTRKARATERGNLLRTGGGPSAPPPPPQIGAMITMVEEAAPMMISEIPNSFDSDGHILDSKNSIANITLASIDETITSGSIDETITAYIDTLDTAETTLEVKESLTPKSIDCTPKYSAHFETTEQVRRPSDNIRREAVMRIRNLENKKKNDMELFKRRLDVEDLKLEKAKIDLEQSSLELEDKKNKIKLFEKQMEVEDLRIKKAQMDVEKAYIELEELKKSISK